MYNKNEFFQVCNDALNKFFGRDYCITDCSHEKEGNLNEGWYTLKFLAGIKNEYDGSVTLYLTNESQDLNYSVHIDGLSAKNGKFISEIIHSIFVSRRDKLESEIKELSSWIGDR